MFISSYKIFHKPFKISLFISFILLTLIDLHIHVFFLIKNDWVFVSVYVFVGEHIALVDFVKCLQRRGLLETGDYVVISVDDEIYDPDPNRRMKITERGKENYNNPNEIANIKNVKV